MAVDESSLDQQQSDERLAAEGYRFYAQEANEFATASLQAVSEVLGCDEQTGG